jgi:monoamine oxidase
VSGLAATARLTQSGVSVHLLEARDRVGGRVRTVRGDPWPVPVDLGAEFIQGRIPELLRVAHSAQLPVVEIAGERFVYRGGTLASADDLIQNADRLLAELAPPSAGGLDLSVAEVLRSAAPTELREVATSWIEAYDAAHIERFSVQALMRERRAEEQIAGDRAFRVTTGYDGVPRAIEATIASERAQIHLETIVMAVDWRPGSVTVRARNAQTDAQRSFTASRLVVALPIGVLQVPPDDPAAVRWAPRLDDKERALQGLEMGSVVKLAFAFKERFWENRFAGQELGFLMTPEEPIGGWWTGYPVYAPQLIAWTGGPAADRLEGSAMDERVDLALGSLGRVLGLDRRVIDEQVVAWDGHDWGKDPFARGAYSYVRVGGMSLQAELARPVADTLFFAGEATEQAGHQATVHGALFAGQRAAEEVLRSLQ